MRRHGNYKKGRWQRRIAKMKNGESLLVNTAEEKGSFWSAAKSLGRKSMTSKEGDKYRCWVVAP